LDLGEREVRVKVMPTVVVVAPVAAAESYVRYSLFQIKLF